MPANRTMTASQMRAAKAELAETRASQRQINKIRAAKKEEQEREELENHLREVRRAMYAVTNSNRGTAYRSRIVEDTMRMAGKTGTTDDLRDSWFAGYDDDRLMVVWVGRDDNKPALMVLRGDHTLNDIKAEAIDGIATPLQFAEEDVIREHFGAGPGSLGPVNVNIRVIADYAVQNAADMAVGANYDGAHFVNFNWGRDAVEPEFADLRNVVAGDPSPDGSPLSILRGIEVGHVFQLGDKYSTALDLTVLDENGKAVTPQMGCYGFGVSRIVAAAIEQCYDDAGICWPSAIAPFELVIIPIKADKSAAVREACEKLYGECREAGIDVAYDDRGLRPGPMFADAELIGIPHRVVVSDRGIEAGTLEYKGRRDSENSQIEFSFEALRQKLAQG
ncbi:YbaK/EbsC family protein, partial [uncultured Salinisphaera sp.]|uniref:His/Gly/Thr/Pro-type tRNA ligase C-terminal domain-containing protein n=1 Tax=uncultured Salinisphaera sp. TaxID=359372 RepID=UPI0032B12AB4